MSKMAAIEAEREEIAQELIGEGWSREDAYAAATRIVWKEAARILSQRRSMTPARP